MYELDNSVNFMLVDDDEIDIKDIQRTFKKIKSIIHCI